MLGREVRLTYRLLLLSVGGGESVDVGVAADCVVVSQDCIQWSCMLGADGGIRLSLTLPCALLPCSASPP